MDSSNDVVTSSRSRWIATVASIWIQALMGVTYAFGIYSPVLKSSQSYDQSTLDTVSVFKDIGGNAGVLSGLLYAAVSSATHRWYGGPWFVLAVGAAQCFLGYFFMWLSVVGYIPPLPVPVMCFLMFIAAHSQTFFSTANVVTGVLNFPDYSGTIVGILKVRKTENTAHICGETTPFQKITLTLRTKSFCQKYGLWVFTTHGVVALIQTNLPFFTVAMQVRYLYTDLYANTIWVGTEQPEKSGKFTSKRMPWSCANDSPLQCNTKPGSHDAVIGYAFSFGEDNRKDVYLLASSGVYRIVHPSRCGFVCSKDKPPNSMSRVPIPSSSNIRNRNFKVEFVVYVLVTYVGYLL